MKGGSSTACNRRRWGNFGLGAMVGYADVGLTVGCTCVHKCSSINHAGKVRKVLD